MSVIKNLPRSVFIACVILLIASVGALLTQIFLVQRVNELRSENNRLERQINSVQTDASTAARNRTYVLNETERYETVLASDLLIPHTRRSVLRMIEEYGLAAGLTRLQYNFEAVGGERLDAVSRQVQDAEYTVNVELVSLDVGALLDRSIFLFAEELITDIPGTAVLRSITLERPSRIDTRVLNSVAESQTPVVVQGQIEFEWRTAQSIRSEGDE